MYYHDEYGSKELIGEKRGLDLKFDFMYYNVPESQGIYQDKDLYYALKDILQSIDGGSIMPFIMSKEGQEFIKKYKLDIGSIPRKNDEKRVMKVLSYEKTF